MRDFLAKLMTVVFGVFLALVASELLLRIFWKPDFLNPKYQRDDFTWMSKNVSLNSYGYRGGEVDIKKNSTTFRIYSLGDSYTFGWYIDNFDDVYTSILHKELTSKFSPKKVEVINAAKPGFSISDSVERFHREGELFAPDVVTLGINIFDLMGKEFAPRYKKVPIIGSSRIYALTLQSIERASVSKKTQEEIMSSLKDGSSELKKLREDLVRLNRRVEGGGGRVILIVFPNYDPAFPNRDVYQYELFHRQMNKLAGEVGIEVVDLYERFGKEEDKRKLVLNPLDAHLSIEANRLVAQEILAKIDFEKLINNTPQFVEQKMVKKKAKIGDKLIGFRAIVELKSDNLSNWTYFLEEGELGVQSNFLNRSAGDRKIPFMTDYLKTARAFTHDGWVGAQIEYNTPCNGEVVIPNRLYGYKVVGIHQITAYFRVKGASHSLDLSLFDLNITRSERELVINLKGNAKKEYDFCKVIVDVEVNQVGLKGEQLENYFITQTFNQKAENDTREIVFNLTEAINELGPTPKFINGGQAVGYVWMDNKFSQAEIIKEKGRLVVKPKGGIKKGQIVEVSVAAKMDFKDFIEVEYLSN